MVAPFTGDESSDTGGEPVEQVDKTPESIIRQLTRAEGNLQEIINGPADIPEDARAGARERLRQVQTALASVRGEQEALDNLNYGERFMLGLARNRPIREISRAINIPQATLASGLTELTQALGGKGDAGFDDFIGGALGLSQAQTGFGEVVEAAVPDLPHGVKVASGLALDLTLDPLNYVFGVGLVGDIGKPTRAGAEAVKLRLARAADLVGDKESRDALLNAAARIEESGIARLSKAELEDIAEVTRVGVGIRAPFTNRTLAFSDGRIAQGLNRGVSKPAGVLGDHLFRKGRVGSRFAEKYSGVANRDLKRAASQGGETYARALKVGDSDLARRALGTRTHASFQERFVGRFGDLNIKTGRPSRLRAAGREHRNRINDLDIRSDAAIDALEAGRTSVKIGSKTIDLKPIRDELTDLHADLVAAGVKVGRVENFVPRILNRARHGVEGLQADWRKWSRTRDPQIRDRQLGDLVKKRRYGPGTRIEIGGGESVVLETGNLAELDELFNRLNPGSFDRALLSNNPLEIIYEYQAAAARLIANRRALADLEIAGFGIDQNSIRGLPKKEVNQELRRRGLSEIQGQDLLKLDNVDLATIIDNPVNYQNWTRARARGAASAMEGRLWYGANELMSRALREGLDSTTGKYLMVRAQEAGMRAELTTMGRPMADDAFTRFTANLSDSQIRNLRGVLNHADGLVPFNQGFKSSPDIVNMLRGKFEFERGVPGLAKINQIFKTQATLSPGFNVRNFYGGMFNNHLAGVHQKHYSRFIKGWDVATEVRRGERAGTGSAELDAIWRKLPPEEEKLFREIYDSGLVESSSRIGDALDATADFLSPNQRRFRPTRTRVGAKVNTRTSAIIDANNRAKTAVSRGVGQVAEGMDRAAGGILGRAVGLRKGLSSGIPVEEVLRGSLLMKELEGGATLIDAHRQVQKFHFDYGDLTSTEQGIRNTWIPFYTFRARNLPLQVEMLARRPGAYNNLLSWQRDMQDRYADPLTPSYYSNFLAAPLEKGGKGSPVAFLNEFLGGDLVATPDLPLNDLFDLQDVVSSAIDLDPVGAGVNLISIPAGDLSPLIKLAPELAFNRSSFTGAPISYEGVPSRRPIAPFDMDRKDWPVYRDLLRLVGVSLEQGGWGAFDSEGNLLVDERVNHAVEQVLPLVGRARRLFPNDERFRDKMNASWLGFVTGGFRAIKSRDRLNAAYEFGESTRRMLDELDQLGYMTDD